MKFLAILKDSLRETLDAKLFYVMVVLSLLTVLLAASVTYTPVSMEDRLKAETQFVNMMIGAQPGAERLNFRFDIENFERQDKRTEPWLGDYQFEYVVKFSLPEGTTPTKDDKQVLSDLKTKMREAINADALRQQFSRLFREVEVTPVKPAAPPSETGDEIRHRVTTKGTTTKSRAEWFHQPALFFGAVNIPIQVLRMSDIITFIATWVIGTFGAAFTMLISVIITASFLPNMLAKGTIDLLLVKPIHRTTLFVYKFLGGLLFMFLNTALIMVGLWLAIGLQTGVWLQSLFLLILVYTLMFAVLYSVSAVAAVLTRSPIVCILVSCLFWALLFALGWAHWGFIENRKEGRAAEASPEVRQHWAFITFDLLHAVTPRYKEIDWLGNKAVEAELLAPRADAGPDSADPDALAEHERQKKRAEELYKKQLDALEKRYGGYTWGGTLAVTGGFIALMLAFACWRFAVKDY